VCVSECRNGEVADDPISIIFANGPVISAIYSQDDNLKETDESLLHNKSYQSNSCTSLVHS